MLTEPKSSTASQLSMFLQEEWKDWKLNYQLQKDSVQQGARETKRVVQSVCRDTQRTVVNTLQNVKTKVGDEYKDLKEDLQVHKSIWTQDAKEVVSTSKEYWSHLVTAATAAGVAMATTVAGRSRRTSTSSSSSSQSQQQPQPQHGDDTVKTTNPSNETENNNHREEEEVAFYQNEGTSPLPSPQGKQQQQQQSQELQIQRIMEEIQSYQETLADPSFVTQLCDILETKLPSSKEMVEYYQARPELGEYTITKELPRMNYTVYTKQGQKLTKEEDISKYYYESFVNQNNNNNNNDDDDDDNHILWRAANQSLFGDIICSLTSETALVRPQYHTATFVDDITVTLDMGRDAPHVTAECYASLCIPRGDTTNDDNNNINNNDNVKEEEEDNAESVSEQRIALAGVLLAVYFCPKANKLEARVLHISPASPSMTREELQGVARNLVVPI